MKINLFFKTGSSKYILCTQYTKLYRSGQRGGGFTGYCIIFLVFSNFHIEKGVQGIKLNIRIMSTITMLKHNIIYKRCLVVITFKSCLKHLKLSALDSFSLCICEKVFGWKNFSFTQKKRSPLQPKSYIVPHFCTTFLKSLFCQKYKYLPFLLFYRPETSKN